MTTYTEARSTRSGRAFTSRTATGPLILLLTVAVLLSGCVTLTTDQKIARGIVVLNDFQDTAAHVYDDAKVQEAAGGKACREAAASRGVPLPPVSQATIVDLRAACDTFGTPIPYDPYKLQALAVPINATYDAIRAANSVRTAVKAGQAGDTMGALSKAADAVRSLLAGAKEVGVKFPPAVLKALEALGL